MLAAIGHTGLQQAVHQAFGQHTHHARITRKSAVANHAAGAKVQVQHRREAEIHAASTQLRGKYVAAGGGCVGSVQSATAG